MKSDRLLSVLLLLQTYGRMSASQLAQRLEVSVRTVYRDVEVLAPESARAELARAAAGVTELYAAPQQAQGAQQPLQRPGPHRPQ